MSLLSYWKMDEGSGLILNDSSGNGNTATINTGASVVWTANAILSGVTSPVWQGTGYAQASIASLTNFTGLTPFSIIFWVKFTAPPALMFMGNLASGPTFPGFCIELTSGLGNQLGFNLIHDLSAGQNLQVTANFGAGLNDGLLHQLVITYAGGSGFGSGLAAGVTFYLDGANVFSGLGIPLITRSDNLTASAASGVPVTFAASPPGNEPFTGAEGYVAFEDVVLTGPQVAALFTAGPAGIVINGQPIQQFLL